MIISDYHVHSDFSSDSSTPAEQMILRALQLGFDRLCMTEHHDMEFPRDVIRRTNMDFQLDLDSYTDKMQQLAETYRPRIQLLTGVELGMKPHLSQKMEDYSKSYDFDFIIGSTHIVDDMDPYYPEYHEAYPGKKGIERYFQVTAENIRAFTGFDSLGHLDYVVRYCPASVHYAPGDFLDYIDDILKRLIQQGKGLEVNTSPLKKGFAYPNPHRDILLRYKELGGEIITIGSDAHTPEALGWGFENIRSLLSSLGFSYYTVYRKRQPEFLPLG